MSFLSQFAHKKRKYGEGSQNCDEISNFTENITPIVTIEYSKYSRINQRHIATVNEKIDRLKNRTPLKGIKVINDNLEVASDIKWAKLVAAGKADGTNKQFERVIKEFITYCTSNGWDINKHPTATQLKFWFLHLNDIGRVHSFCSNIKGAIRTYTASFQIQEKIWLDDVEEGYKGLLKEAAKLKPTKKKAVFLPGSVLAQAIKKHIAPYWENVGMIKVT